MTAPTLTVDGNDVLPYLHDRTLSVKFNEAAFTLVYPAVGMPALPLVTDPVEITSPTWSGTVSGVETTIHWDGTVYIAVQASNDDALVSLGPVTWGLWGAARDLAPPIPGAYDDQVLFSDLVFRTTGAVRDESLSVENRMSCKILDGAIPGGGYPVPGQETWLTVDQLSWSEVVVSIMEATKTWPTADQAVWELDLGLGTWAAASTGAAGGGPLTPPTVSDEVTNLAEVAIANAIGMPAFVFDTINAPGSGDIIAVNSGIALFDVTAPVTQAFGDAAATGSAAFAARRDHRHGMPVDVAGKLYLHATRM